MDTLNIVSMDVEIDFIKSVLTNDLLSGGFPILYKGNLDHESMRVFTDISETKMIKQGVNTNCVRKTYHILVESLQNISRHSDNIDEESRGNGIFLFSQDVEFFYIVTGNKLLLSKKEDLEKKMHFINQQTISELRQMRRLQMRDGEWSDKGGAGLGLIDIARKSGEKLQYHFIPIDDKYTYFILKISVKKEY
jgi:hypothetical protein